MSTSQTTAPAADSGVVFELQRWSIHDGPGARTVVFLKGCPLRCQWCCNPESQAAAPQIAIAAQNCIDCGRCLRACPQQVALPATQGAFREGSRCLECGRCVDACPANARQCMGQRMSVEQVMHAVERDAVFYRRSGGGVTFSGGEPLAQPLFLGRLLDECRSLDIHTALETSGHFPWASAADAVQRVDLVFLDIKHMHPAIHRKLTGVSNQLILQNAVSVTRSNVPLVIRIPVVPGLNDSVENIQATAEFVAHHLDGRAGIELLPYHRLGRSKYVALGMPYTLDGIEAPSPEALALLRVVVAEAGVRNVTAAGLPYEAGRRE